MNCKNCGAELFEQNAVDGVIECEYCFSRHTLPKKAASPAALEFMRMGEHDLDTGRFDDAYAAYEKAAEIDKEEPEACFGMALALFKVQYIKDEVNNRLQPICHELTEKKFQEDSRYLSALNLATEAQKKEYQKRAEEIDYIRNEFVELKNSGLDFDCFLCVKVTGADGEKTEDSKDADYIYDLLKDRGFKPFYSERNIRNRTGADYEAMILYALHTSETMLVVCREEEYLQTPWVKNEYARFLRLLNDSEKESEAVQIVYYEKPIEKLAGKRGKTQGIDFSRRDADRKICDFVESHTAEAKLRRQREEEEKRKREEKLLKEIEEQRKAREEERRAREEAEARLKTVQGGGMSAMQQILSGQIDRLTEESRKKEEEKRALAQKKKEEEEAARRRAIARDNDPTLQNYNRAEFEINGTVLRRYGGNKAEVIIPRGVTEIGDYVFNKYTLLTNITIPDSVTSIGLNAFNGCSGITEIHYKGTIAGWCKISGLYNFTIKSGRTIYIDGKKLAGELIIPDGVTSIENVAFGNCASLTNVKIPDSVTSIGDSTFCGCSGLTSITIPNSVTSIGNSTFVNCTSLTNVKIPDSVTSIGHSAFGGCSGLTSVTIGNSVTGIGHAAFYGCSGLTSVTIPDSVTGIGDYAFSGCSGLTSITIPNGVTSIGEEAFADCTSLTNVTIPRRFKRKRKKIFKGCQKIEFTFTE